MEKALPAKRRRAAKGTVLFTVVAVMMVLIVFLMGTLALAATANKRAQRNYQREQTRANAKAAIDATIDAINQSDKAVGGLKEQLSKLDDPTDQIAVNVTGSDGLAVPVVIHYDSAKTVYNKAEEKWVTGAIYRIEATSTMQSTGVTTTYNAYLADDSIVSGGNGPGSSGGGGAFVTTGGIGGENIGTSGYVAGGTEIALGNTRPFKTDGTNDYLIENTTVIQAPFYVNGNLKLSTQSTARFSKLGDYFAIMGNFTTTNDLLFEYDDNLTNWADTQDVDYYQVPCMYVGGTYSKGGTNSSVLGTATTPINLYAGEIQFDKGIALYGNMYMFKDGGNSYIDYAQGGDTTLYTWASKQLKNSAGNSYTEIFGGVYCNGNLELKNGNGTRTEYIGNELRVKGDLFLNNTGNKLELYVGKDSTAGTTGKEALTGKSGDVVVGGKLKLSSNAILHVPGNLYAKEIELNGGTLDVAGTVYSEAAPFQTGVTVTKTGETVYYFAGAGGTGDPAFNYTFKGFNQYTGWQTEYDVTWNMSKVSQEYDASGNPVGAPVVQDYSGAEVAVVQSDGDRVAPADPTEKIRQWMDTKVPGFNTAYFGQANAYHQEHTSSVAKDSVQVADVAAAYQTAKGDTIYPQGYDGGSPTSTLESKIVKLTATPAYAQTIAAMDSTISRPAVTMNYDDLATAGAKFKVCDADGSNITEIEIADQNDFNNNVKNSGKYIYIDAATKLEGTWGLPIYVDAKSAMILEIADGFSMTGKEILIKDTNTVYFFLDGEMSMNNSNIWTTTYKAMLSSTVVDNGTTYCRDYSAATPMTVTEVCTNEADPYYPNVIVYSADGAKFSASNGGIHTAHFRAQGLDYSYAATGYTPAGKIKYSQYDDAGNNFITEKHANVGLIGQLITKTVTVANNWGMMYVTLPKTPQTPNPVQPPTPGNGQRAVPDRVIPMYYNYY